MRLLVLVAAALILMTPQALGACTAYQYPGNTGALSIGICTGTGWSTAPPIQAAVNMWEDGCEDMPGSQFPSLLPGMMGDITVDVSKVAGQVPELDAGCAMFNASVDGQGRVVGGTIEIYDRDSANQDCMWVLPHVTLDNLIAHELGHVLGLANVECPGYIMGPNWATATVNGSECDSIDEFWSSAEETEQEMCDSGCMNPPCIGNPPKCSICCSPLVLDLNGDGIRTTSVADGVTFDITGDGRVDRVGWTAGGADDGFLYFDLNKNHLIDGGHELFGEASPRPNGGIATNGFDALLVYDRMEKGGDSDGAITPRDAVWGRLRLWVDRNHDGVMTMDEDHSLGELHVLQLNLPYTVMGPEHDFGRDAAGNLHLLQGTFVQRITGAQGNAVETRKLHDIYFMTDIND